MTPEEAQRQADRIIDHVMLVWPKLKQRQRAGWARRIADHLYDGDYDRAYDRAYGVLSGEEER